MPTTRLAESHVEEHTSKLHVRTIA